VPPARASARLTEPALRDRSAAGEASGCLVAPAVFNTDVTEHLGQVGSIPIRLRQQPPAATAGPGIPVGGGGP